MEQENDSSFKERLGAWGRFFASPYFIKNICIYIGSIILFFILVFFCLRIYTRHSQKISVPSVEGLTVDDAIRLIGERKLAYEITDSVYTGSAKPGTVIEGGQLPPAGYNVKQGRIVYLTIKAWGKEPTSLPNVVNMSLNDAQVQLVSAGLVLGKVTTQPGGYKDYVVEARYKGARVSAGKALYKGDVIDLVVQVGTDEREDLDDSSLDMGSDSDDGSDSDGDGIGDF